MPYIVRNKIDFLSSTSKILSSSLDYNVTLVSIAKLVVESVADFCMIDLFDEGELKRVTVKMFDKKKNKLAQKFYNFPPDPKNKSAIYDAARLGYPIIIKETTDKWLENVSNFNNERILVRELGFTSLIFVPLQSRNEVIGVITIASIEKGFSYDMEDSIFIKEIADRAAITVDKARLYSQAQEAIKTRDEFLAIASHELKTPLTSILLSLQLILKRLKKTSQSDDELTKSVEVAIETSKRMSVLIKDLLNVSLTSSEYFQIYPEPLNLSELLKEIYINFELLLKNKNQKLLIKENEKNLIVSWDKIRMEQAISNLVSNSIKYGLSKPITIYTEKKENIVKITVEDKGIGISNHEKKVIFDVFKRGEAIKKKYGGIGVGLFIASKIVEAHNGEITIEDKKGKGSKFIIQIPQ